MSGDGAIVAYPLFQTGDGGSLPTSPLQFTIYEINVNRAMDLNRKWHSVLPKTHLGNLVGKPKVVCYGAFFNEKIYAVAIWTSPIAANRMKDGWLKLELRRLAICSDAPKNTASRMISIMTRLIHKKYPDIKSLISYQSVQHHNGTIYKASGWIPTNLHSFMEWKSSKPGRSRVTQQIESDKIRWEKDL